jgi:hypothetical protein
VLPKARGLWRTLEFFAESNPPAAVLAEWRLQAGNDFDFVQRYLGVTTRLALDYPCVNDPSCRNRHGLSELDDGRWLACVPVGRGPCRAVSLTRDDLWIHELDAARFGGDAARALGLTPAPLAKVVTGAPKAFRVGTFTETQSPVILMLCPSQGQLLANLQGVSGSCGEPFIVLAPTAQVRSELAGSFLQRERCAFIALDSCLAPNGAGFQLATPMAPVLERFKDGLMTGRSLVKTVERIDRNIEAVAQNQYELRKENAELRQLNKDGYFNFAVRVNGEDFLAFAVIMALGNRKAAAEHLKIPARTLYHRVDQWAGRGREYKLMLRYLEWRKRSSRHLKVELNPSLQSGESDDQAENPETMADVLTEIEVAKNQDYPALLAEVLQALQRQNSGNWTAVRQELVEMIKDEV